MGHPVYTYFENTYSIQLITLGVKIHSISTTTVSIKKETKEIVFWISNFSQ